MTLIEELPENSTEPLYKQIKQLIVSKIEAGEWRPGDRLPTEHALVKELKTSRMTVNRAFRELTQEGVLVRRQGSGTFVSPSKLETGMLEIRNVAEDITARGNEHSSEVLLLETVDTVPAEIAETMTDLPRGAAFHSLCLHFENGRPLQLEDRYVNPRLVPDFLKQDFSVQTTGGYLLDNVIYTHADHRISAAIPTEEQKKLLRLEEGEPVLVLERHTYCPDGVITTVRLYHPASRYEFSGTFFPHRELSD
ncbi:histidine utilization repressor [Sneathiella chinensis]|uniref:Histidine utilization repressor n=1 Tax=Sneathiella chinensis TaxID=349750 RepID=A0ABQ5U5U7_9PROT|nr:histidine utilization repressor [Sneathiella chinensis]GLQ06603.1 histidine utilization repressor [Sneathiella chinensis]